jgi:hypothetical protein
VVSNWNTPFILSPHNPSVMYLGGRTLFISRDRGTELDDDERELGKNINTATRRIMESTTRCRAARAEAAALGRALRASFQRTTATPPTSSAR